MFDTRTNCPGFLRKPLANQRDAMTFFLPLGKACRYFFGSFVPSSRASFAPANSILMIVAAVIYFVSPFDLIPDSIPVLGLVDDASVLTFVAGSNLTLIS